MFICLTVESFFFVLDNIDLGLDFIIQVSLSCSLFFIAIRRNRGDGNEGSACAPVLTTAAVRQRRNFLRIAKAIFFVTLFWASKRKLIICIYSIVVNCDRLSVDS